MQYRRSQAQGATFFFTVVTYNRKRILWVDFIKHVEYIHFDPVKHRLEKSPIDWPYSSFHRYVKQGIYDSNWGAGAEINFDENVGYE